MFNTLSSLPGYPLTGCVKQATIGALIATTTAQAALQIKYYQHVWAGDFRFWTTILTIVSLFVILYIQYIEHWRSRNANGVVLFYWLFLLIAYAVKLRSLVSQQVHREHVAYFGVFCASVGLAGLSFVLEWLVPKRMSDYDMLGDDDECPYEYADVFSVLTFGWMTPLMKRGYKTFLTQDDLWNLRKRDSTRHTSETFEKAWEYEMEKKYPSLWLAMFRSFGGPYFRGAAIKTVSDVLNFAQPQLLRLLITFVDSYRTDHPQPIIRGAAIALAMFAVSVSQTACLHQYFQRSFETGMRIKSSLTAAIYSKSTRLSNEGRASKSTGDIVNYMAVDTQRLQDLAQRLEFLVVSDGVQAVRECRGPGVQLDGLHVVKDLRNELCARVFVLHLLLLQCFHPSSNHTVDRNHDEHGSHSCKTTHTKQLVQ